MTQVQLPNVDKPKTGTGLVRFDVGGLASKFSRTPSGGFVVPGDLAKVGIQAYEGPDGSVVREYRPQEEVASEASYRSFDGATVTLLHPEDLVTPSTWRSVAIGHVRNPRMDAGRVVADLHIEDAEAIGMIERGELRELSAGYTCDLESAPGVWEGQPYELVQRRIRGNHVALGPSGWGRAGPSVSLRLDGRGHQLTPGRAKRADSREEKIMRKVRVDGIEFEAGSDGHLQAVDKELAKKDSAIVESKELAAKADAARAELQKKLDELQGRFDSLTAELAKAKTEHAEHVKKHDAAWSKEQVDQRVAARLALVDRARRVLGAEYEHSGKSDSDVMRDALAKVGAKVDEKTSDDYLRGRFEQVTDMAETPEEDPPEETSTLDSKGRVQVTKSGEGKPPLSGMAKVRADNAAFREREDSGFAMDTTRGR